MIGNTQWIKCPNCYKNTVKVKSNIGLNKSGIFNSEIYGKCGNCNTEYKEEVEK